MRSQSPGVSQHSLGYWHLLVSVHEMGSLVGDSDAVPKSWPLGSAAKTALAQGQCVCFLVFFVARQSMWKPASDHRARFVAVLRKHHCCSPERLRRTICRSLLQWRDIVGDIEFCGCACILCMGLRMWIVTVIPRRFCVRAQPPSLMYSASLILAFCMPAYPC